MGPRKINTLPGRERERETCFHAPAPQHTRKQKLHTEYERQRTKGGVERKKMGISEVKKRGLISVQKDKAILCCSVFTVFGVKNM